MKKMVLMLVVSLLAVSLSIAAQTRRKATPRKPAKAIINLQAGLVYQQTGPEMLARATFYLLDDDLVSILQNAGIGPSLEVLAKQKAERDSKLGDTSASPPEHKELAAELRAAHPNALYPLFDILWSSNLGKIEVAMQPHIKGTLTTDFNGVAQSGDISPGTYFVYGQVQTHSRWGRAVWNLRVEVKPGQNQIILDQNNMVPGSR